MTRMKSLIMEFTHPNLRHNHIVYVRVCLTIIKKKSPHFLPFNFVHRKHFCLRYVSVLQKSLTNRLKESDAKHQRIS